MAARLSRLSACALAALLLGAPLRTAAAQAESSAAGWRQVITGDALRRAGVMRIGEVLRLARAWDAATVDEYTWRASAGALALFGDDTWRVFVDGHPVGVALLGVIALERLPLDLGAVDSIVLLAAPVLDDGEAAAGGALHVHTRRAAAGASARAHYATGSETGDPGPFGFLPGAPLNRDRYGHDASVGAAYGGHGWHAAAAVGLGAHIATDSAIAGRLLATGGFPRIERVAQSLRFGFSGAGGEHQLMAGQSRIDDWFRLEANGVEVPVRSTFAQAGASGVVPVRRLFFGYRLDYDRSTIRSLPVVRPELVFIARTASATLQVSDVTAASRRAGLSLVHRDLESTYSLEDARTFELRAFGEVAWDAAPALRQALGASVGHAAGASGGAVTLETRWQASARDAFALLLAGHRPLPAAQVGLAPLVLRGFDWLGDAGVGVSIEKVGRRDAQGSADIVWMRRLARGTRVSAAVLYRASRSAFLAREALAFDSLRFAWRGPVRLEQGQAQVGGFKVGVEASLSSTAAVTGWYRAQWLLSGDDRVRDAWHAPRHAAAVEGTWTPVRNLELYGRVGARSASRWGEYSGTAALDDVASRTAGGVGVDLGARKWFWRRRFAGFIGVRNLLDRDLVSHPEGSSARLAFLLSGEAALP